jgi:hypothetical protein
MADYAIADKRQRRQNQTGGEHPGCAKPINESHGDELPAYVYAPDNGNPRFAGANAC